MKHCQRIRTFAVLFLILLQCCQLIVSHRIHEINTELSHKVSEIPYSSPMHEAFANTITTGDSNNCSSVRTCSCKHLTGGGVKAHCSGLGLNSIPNFSNDVTEIDLSRNYLRHFPNNSKFPGKLVSLDLSNNVFNNFDYAPFQGLHHLIKLDLSGNKLHYIRLIFKAGIFKDLTNLRVLNLKGNNGIITSKRYYPEEIANINTLRELHLDGLRDGIFSEHFSNLSFLSTLDFSGHSFNNCRIKRIAKNILPNISSIEFLSFSMCDLRDIEKGSFEHFSNLTTLDISNNNYLSFRSLRNLTFDLQFTKIKLLDLTYLHCPAGVGSMIMPSDIEYLSNTSLEELYLRFNRLELIGEGVVKLLPKSLKILDVAWNNMNLITLTELMELFTMPRLQQIQLCCQGPHRHNTRVSNLVNCHDWRGPYEYNTDINVRKNIGGIHELGKIINRSKSKIIETNRMVVNVVVSKSITDVDVHWTDIYGNKETSVLEIHISEPNNIRKIDMGANNFHKWPVIFRNVDKLEYLSIADNGCSSIPTDSLYHFPSLLYLNIENNNFGEMLSSDTGGKYFQYLNNLTHLMMQNNGLGYIPNKLFVGLPNLRVLSINMNVLSEWHVDIGHMYQLERLDLSSNRIQTFDKKTRDQIDTILKTSNITIDLHDNSLQCTCGTLDFLTWMNKRKNIFIHFDSYKCLYNNLYLVSMKDFDNTINKLEKHCSSYLYLIVGVLVCVSIVVFSICGAIIYRYRWKLRYLYFMAKQGNRPIADKMKFEFDAFVSYANEDGHFVEYELLEKMEEHYGLKLRLHRRDFIPGHPIAENITDNIHRSHRTVAILSNNYLNSYWCKFEFNMARMESVYSRGGEPTLFIVLLEDIKPRDLPLAFMDVIEADSYIKVPEIKNDEFWENFYKGLSMM